MTRAAGVAAGTAVVGSASAQSSTTHTVKMVSDSQGKYFDPVGLHVAPGDTVKWVIDSGSHSATAYTPDNPRYSGGRRIPQGAENWDSSVLEQSGKSFSHTFETEGTYDYYCIPHRTLGMVGRIVCGSPGGPATQSEIPDQPVGVLPSSKTIVEEGTLEWPYIPNEGHGGPPPLFWAATGLFSLTSVYLFSIFDRESGRYSDLPDIMRDDD